MVIALSCPGQKRENPLSSADSIRLFDPKPEPFSGEDVLMFKNSIVLFHPTYTVIQDSSENTFSDLKALSKYIQNKAAVMRQRKFYVLIDSNTRADKIIPVLDLMLKHRIEKYKIVNYKAYFKPSEPIIIKQPRVTTVPMGKAFDSTYLSIDILGDSIEVRVLSKREIVTNQSTLDQFITSNKTMIDRNKIVLLSEAGLPYERYKFVMGVLRKHEYYRYEMITK